MFHGRIIHILIEGKHADQHVWKSLLHLGHQICKLCYSNEEISLQKNKLIDDSEDWLEIDLDDKNFDDYLEMYSNGNVNSTYDFKLISDAFNKFLDLKKPKSTQSNVDFKNISNSDEELIDFDVNLIE